jgi:hypothetical protein
MERHLITTFSHVRAISGFNYRGIVARETHMCQRSVT